MSIPIVYIAGPYRAFNAWEREKNIRTAEQLAFEVWKMGAAVLCPHTNSRFFDGAIPDETILQGCIAMMNRCDAVLMAPNWQKSEGARNERRIAKKRNMFVTDSLAELRRILQFFL